MTARVLNEAYFFVPYTAVYALAIGLSVSELIFAEAVFAAVLVVADIPLGHLADKVGEKFCVVTGTIVHGTALMLIGLVHSPELFVMLQPVIAFGLSFCMGADSSLQRKLAMRRSGRNRFELWEQRFQTSRLVVTALCFALASVLAKFSPSLTFIATALSMYVAAGVFWVLPTPPSSATAPPCAADQHRSQELSTLTGRVQVLTRGLRRGPGLGRDVAAMVLVGTTFSLLLYLIPLFYETSGVPTQWIGGVAAVVLLASSFCTALLFRGNAGLTLPLLATGICCFLLPMDVLAIALAGGLLANVSQAVAMPKFRTRIVDELSSLGKSTALSLVTTARNVGFALLAPLLGVLTAVLGVAGLAAVSGALIVVGVALATPSLVRVGSDSH
ncbi:MFS transporter [Corynebacterium heidelbergense]|uniref:MFS transporter n=1 Tax=Corynebacterium heidelbergense TaxID=2055947 RepID=A0A364VA47_9CORY|nr:MFS transporter [Corynebacterium heidelbergense]RAV33519.1 hypothetical protein CWC39_08070 [Corynebacterium heidelbergense]WCZ36110.1 Major Facilitator Superfamily protein [Corynebacterium heidelbergense]